MKSFGEIADETSIFEGSVGYGKYIVSRESLGDFYATMLIEHNEIVDELQQQIYDSISKSEARDMLAKARDRINEMYMIASMGSCTCFTKTPNAWYHADSCKYKMLDNIRAKPLLGE